MSPVKLTVGTFNLNNLFSRFSFKADLAEAATAAAPGAVITEDKPAKADGRQWVFRPDSKVYVREYLGKLIEAKPDQETQRVAARIKEANIDVLAVQEVEDRETLQDFDRYYLGGRYPHHVLVEGNDDRFIDVALLSKFPLGRVTSWQKYVFPPDSGREVFSRDLLQVDVWDASRARMLFTLLINHLKSQFVPFNDDPAKGKEYADQRRNEQAQAIRNIARELGPDAPYIILGDMNDGLGAPTLAPLAELGVVNALAHAQETRPLKETPFPPSTTLWTHRFGSGAKVRYELFDQIWVSPALAGHLGPACIGRRKNLTGDGSDHDPAWVELEL